MPDAIINGRRGNVDQVVSADGTVVVTNGLGPVVDLSVAGTSPTLAGLTVGDGTTSPVVTIDKDGAGTGTLRFIADSAENPNGKRLLHDTDETLKLQTNIAGVWTDVLTVDNAANVAFSSATPTLTIGTGAGAPTVLIAKSGGNASQIQLRGNGAANAANDKRLLHQTDESLTLEHFDGATWNIVQQWDNSLGSSFSGNVTLGSASPTLQIGSNAGSPTVSHRGTTNPSLAYEFRLGASTNRQWDFGRFTAAALGTTNNAFAFRRFNNGTDAVTDYPLYLDETTGDAVFANDAYVGSQLTVGATSQTSWGVTRSAYRRSTTDASSTDIAVATLSANQRTMMIRWWVTAALDSGDNFFSKVSTDVAVRTGGTVTLPGPFPDDASIASGAGATLTAVLVVSGDDILLRLNGNAGEDWEWSVMVDTQQGGLSS